MAKNTKNGQNTGNDATETDAPKRKRKQQDPEARKARQVAQGIARRFFAMLYDAIRDGAETVTIALNPADGDNGISVKTVHAALTRLITVSLGGRLERARVALEALRAVVPENSDGWIPQLVVGRVDAWAAAGGSQQLALSLTDPMLPPSEYVTMDYEEDRDFDGALVPIKNKAGEVQMVDGSMFGLMAAIRFRENVAPATIAGVLGSWIDLPVAQLDPRERVKSAIAQYESIVTREPDSVSGQQNLDDLRSNLETLNADPSYIEADARASATQSA